MFVFLSLLIAGLGLLYHFVKNYENRDLKYYTDQGFTLLQSKLSFWDVFTGKRNVSDFDIEYYKKLGQLKQDVGVVMELGTPILLLRNLDIARDIFIKDFDHFPERRGMGKFGKILDDGLFLLKGEEWRNMRTFLSPTFSSGKIRNMFPHFVRSANNLNKYFKTQQGNSTEFDIPITDSMQKFTIQVIASAAFGLSVDSFFDKDDSFLKMSQRMGQFSVWKKIRLVISQQFPKFAKMFNITGSQAEIVNYFWGLISSTLDIRESGGVKGNDFLQMLVDAQAEDKSSQKLIKWDNDTLVPQAFSFIAAGFDTVANNLSVACYILATHFEIQEHLYEELKRVMENEQDHISYEEINGLEYLEMFLSEVLRLYPPNARFDRVCNKDYSFPESENGTTSIPKVIKKGTIFAIPADAFHKDEQYFPNPMKFDPTHFTKENKVKRNPYAYMPFGIGPRNCIGNRFAIMETKVAIAFIVKNFVIKPTEMTPVPARIKKDVLGYKVSNDINLRFIQR